MGSLNDLIEDHIKSVGGYWPPTAGLLRLYEEILEYQDAHSGGQSEECLEELADIVIIVTCLENQYCISGASPTAILETGTSENTELIGRLQRLTSELSRAVLHVEGIKNRKAKERLRPIEDITEELKSLCFLEIFSQEADVETLVQKQTEIKTRRDSDRFIEKYDPVLCDCVQAFRAIQNRTMCPFASSARVWGAPDWKKNLSEAENHLLIGKELLRFCTVQQHVNLDGFVVQTPADLTPDIKSLAAWFRSFLTDLARSEGRNPFDGISKEDWQFEFGDTRLFTIVFSHCYGLTHPRQTYGVDGSFVFFQPERSFERKKSELNRKLDLNVSERFKSEGYLYFDDIMDGNLEAVRYLKPLRDTGPLHWWQSSK